MFTGDHGHKYPSPEPSPTDGQKRDLRSRRFVAIIRVRRARAPSDVGGGRDREPGLGEGAADHAGLVGRRGDLREPQAARVFLRVQKLDRGPGDLGVEIVRAREGASDVSAGDSPRPRMVLLDSLPAASDVPELIDRLVGGEGPLLRPADGAGDLAPAAEPVGVPGDFGGGGVHHHTVGGPVVARDEAIGELRDGRGTQFDPDVVDTFLALHARGEIHELPPLEDLPQAS